MLPIMRPAPSASLPPLERLRLVVAHLRAPDGCPWDREQTHASLRAGLLEEAHEVIDAINLQDDANLREELGDLLLQVVFHAQIATEEGRFDLNAVAHEICEKLVRRHPHVFGTDQCANSDEVLVRWDEIKRAEKGHTTESLLEGISKGLPALIRSQKTQKKAAKIGFDWDSPPPVLEKIREELREVEAELGGDPRRIEEEIGDLLFSVVNLARKTGTDAEVALLGAVERFSSRFRKMEALAQERRLPLESLGLEKLDHLWDEVKRAGA